MGYREDVIYAYTSEGWDKLLEAIKGLPSTAKKPVTDLINEADEARATDAGERMLKFESIKTGSADFQAFMDLHAQIPLAEYVGVFMGEDGAEEFKGGYYFHNPFCPSICHTLTHDEAGECITGSVLDETNMGYDTPTLPAPAPIVDDHTCPVCGNTKCSKTEKACWKCGAPI